MTTTDTNDLSSQGNVVHVDDIERERLMLVCRQWVRSPYFAAVTSAYIVYLLWGPQSNRVLLIAWAATVVGLLFARLPLCYWILAQDKSLGDVRRWSRLLTATAFINGVAGGAAGWLFFEGTGLQNDAFLTMILGCWSAAAISTAGAYPITFYLFVVPFLLPVTVQWFAMGGDVGVPLGSLLVLFCLLEVSFARDSGKMTLEAVRLKFANIDLIGKLERSNEEAQHQRDRAEAANLAKSRFLEAASHDLRNPLHAIGIYSRLLKDVARRGKAAVFAEDIATSVQALDSLFESLLDISRLDTGDIRANLERFPANRVLGRVAREANAKARAKGLDFRYVETHEVLVSDPLLFEQIVRNLVENALRYTPRGSVDVGMAVQGTNLVLTVSDTGPGIPVSEREAIFESYYRSDSARKQGTKGRGLGLAIVKRACGLLGAEISIDASPSGGSCFSISFPGRVEQGEAGRGVGGDDFVPDAHAPLVGVSILFVDDDPEIRWAMDKLLTAWGCTSMVASSVGEALCAAKGMNAPLDLVISDLKLASGETGIAAIESVKTVFPQVGGLLVTGEISADLLEDARASRIEVLRKPVIPERLLESIRKNARPKEVSRSRA